MKNVQSQEALVAAYWRKLARSIEGTYKSPGRPASKRTSKDNRSALAHRISNSSVRRTFGVKAG